MTIRVSRSLLPLFSLIFAGVIGVGACGSTSEPSQFTPEAGAPVTAVDPIGFGDDAGGGKSGFAACATDTRKGKPLPLDLYLMFDTSGSMLDATALGPSKYAAVKSAMTSFFGDARSEGIGVGLKFFPTFVPTAPLRCTTPESCGAFGPCSTRACLDPSSQDLIFCSTDADCAPGIKCANSGVCTFTRNAYCATDGQTTVGCPLAATGGETCATFPGGSCIGRDSCATADYTAPIVPIASLPGNSSALVSALETKKPEGGTPTSAALQGALEAAKGFAEANAGHTVAVVFVTDGLPTACDRSVANISAMASAAAAASPSIKTFVIGVFSPEEKARAETNLNSIAAGGGTSKAFMVDTGTNVSQAFQLALNVIRGSALPCEYVIPTPESGLPDLDKLNLEVTQTGGNKTTVFYVKNPAGCDEGKGWYYDAEPGQGTTPGNILLCPSTCDMVRGDPNAQVDVVLGCQTLIQVK